MKKSFPGLIKLILEYLGWRSKCKSSSARYKEPFSLDVSSLMDFLPPINYILGFFNSTVEYSNPPTKKLHEDIPKSSLVNLKEMNRQSAIYLR